MADSEKHIIHKVSVDVQAGTSTEPDVLNQKIHQMVHETILSKIETYLTDREKEIGNHSIRIDRLELDLAIDNPDSLSTKLSLGTQLTEQLDRHFRSVSAIKGPATDSPERVASADVVLTEEVRRLSPEERKRETLFHFLETGTTPWWIVNASEMRELVNNENLLQLVREDLNFRIQLDQLLERPIVLERLTLQFSPATVISTLIRLNSDKLVEPETLQRFFGQTLRDVSSWSRPVRQQFWKLAIKASKIRHLPGWKGKIRSEVLTFQGLPELSIDPTQTKQTQPSIRKSAVSKVPFQEFAAMICAMADFPAVSAKTLSDYVQITQQEWDAPSADSIAEESKTSAEEEIEKIQKAENSADKGSKESPDEASSETVTDEINGSSQEVTENTETDIPAETTKMKEADKAEESQEMAGESGKSAEEELLSETEIIPTSEKEDLKDESDEVRSNELESDETTDDRLEQDIQLKPEEIEGSETTSGVDKEEDISEIDKTWEEISEKYEKEEPSESPKKLREPEGFIAEHAGLLLLHPFLKSFCEKWELLTEDRELASPEYMMHVLHFLATGREQDYEYAMTFEKFICGIDPETVPDRTIELSEEIKASATDLLNAVIEYWTVLKGSSLTLLRNEFLQRPARIVEKDGALRFTFERKSLDILVDRLPWTISFLKLPWKKGLIYVEW